MNLLAIDTSSIACSVALDIGGEISERHEEQPREHTRLLIPMITELLQTANITASDLNAVVLGNGPGSFIGMRIAASVAQGFAFGASLDVVPVSSLAAVAAEVFASADAEEVAVTQDAHMSEVYLGIYRRDAAGLPVAMAPERLQTMDIIEGLDPRSARSRVAAGFGWRRYPELAALNRDLYAGLAAAEHPRARFLLTLAGPAMATGGTVSPEDVQPAYLRQKVAEKPAGMP